jgi:hypothetical protein
MKGIRIQQNQLGSLSADSAAHHHRSPCGHPGSSIDLRGNDVREECICVPKVYDWVIVPNHDRNKVLIPEPCRVEVEALLDDGVPIRVEVIQPVVPPRFPISCGPQSSSSSVSCSVIPPVRHITIPSPVNGRPIEVSLVRFLFVITVTVVVFRDDTATEVCRFDTTIQLDDDIVLCLPEPLDESNIRCRVVDLSVVPSGVIFDGLVELSVQLCKEIQVQADVKLEVLARFCHPRSPIVPPSLSRCQCLPEIEFPPQCPDLFPRPDCSCQGAVRSTDNDILAQLAAGASATGVACINAEICSNCNPVSTNVLFRFTDNSNDASGSVLFESQLLEALGCFNTLAQINAFIASLGLPASLLASLPTLNNGAVALAAQGRGSITPAGSAAFATYTLLMIENAFPSPPVPLPTRDVYIISISDGVNLLFATVVPVPDVNLQVRSCRDFPVV